MLPAQNATLLSIAGGGFTSDYDLAETTDTPRWEGSAGAYVVEEILTVPRIVRASSDGVRGVDEVTRTYIVLDGDLGRQVQVGDSLTYSHEGATVTRKARNVRVTPIVNTARVTFENL